jgi:hypothetical protein
VSPAASGDPLQLAIVNQVFFHLEVVAGAMHVLRDFSSEPLTIYLHEKVMNTNWYGFKSWMGTQQGVIWKDCKDYDGKKQYDVVWFVSPEYHLPWVAARVAEMKPKVALHMVHNGHIKDEDMQKVLALTSGSTVYTLAPHVAKYITNRTKAPTEWILPIFPYTPANVCALADLQVRSSQGPGGPVCLLLRQTCSGAAAREQFACVWCHLRGSTTTGPVCLHAAGSPCAPHSSLQRGSSSS